MTLQLQDTLTRKKEEFAPQSDSTVTMYTCGPTVYDFAHIGNLRSYIFSDILHRTLLANDFKVNMAMNITDVGHLTDDADAGEDKMEKGAAREGKTAREIASYYTDAFLEDSRDLNLLEPTVRPKATDHIQEQIDLILRLEEKGLTYATSDGVYYDTAKFPEYGKLAQLDIEGLQEGARVEKNKEKKQATDFALWKFSPKDTQRAMEWDSPWGTGFPGWHIECSAMAMKHLGETIDIHTGGIDHIPVHHTNEIAQSEGATGKPFARFWLHGEFLLINEGRMGKSEGNFLTLDSLREKGYSPLAYRYFTLTAHYRSKLNFSWEAMDNAQNSYNKLVSAVMQWDQPGGVNESYVERFMDAVNNDLGMPEALAVMWELVKSAEETSTKAATMAEMEKVLGLGLAEAADELKGKIANAGEDVMALLRERNEARAEKNFEAADALRDQIAALGFAIEDTDDGTVLKVQQ